MREAYKNFEKKPLTEWLLEKGIEKEIAETILHNMKALGYSDVELLDIDYALSHTGFLFLHNLFKEFKKQRIDVMLLESLKDHLEEKESTQALAHFIWIGSHSDKISELFGVRSLKKAKPTQKIYFWVLEEEAEFYRTKIKELSLTDVDIISIEDYARKTQYSLKEEYSVESRGSLLEKMIEIRELSKHAKQKFENVIDEEERKGWKLLVVKCNIIIVDYIKSLIPIFEGGWVFDADIFFDDEHPSKNTLPLLKKWIFPVLNYAGGKRPDIWFFASCQRLLFWNSEDYTCDILKNYTHNQLDTYYWNTSRVFSKLQMYAKAAEEGRWREEAQREYPSARPCSSLAELFDTSAAILGSSILGLLSQGGYYRGSLQMAYSTLQRANNFSSDKFLKSVLLSKLYHLKNNEFYLIKRYNGSHRAKVNQCNLLTDALSIPDFSLMKKFIIQKIELANLDIGSIYTEAVTLSDRIVNIKNTSILDMATIFRPEAISIILEIMLDIEDVKNKLTNFFEKEVEIPDAIFQKVLSSSESITSISQYKLIPLIEKLETFSTEDDPKRNVLSIAKKKIQLTHLFLLMEIDIKRIKPGDIQIKNMLLTALKEILKTGKMSDASIAKIEEYQLSFKNGSVKLFKASPGRLLEAGEFAIDKKLFEFLSIAAEVGWLTLRASDDATKRAPH